PAGGAGLGVEVVDDRAGEAGERAVDVGRVHQPRLDGVGGRERGPRGRDLRHAGKLARGYAAGRKSKVESRRSKVESRRSKVEGRRSAVMLNDPRPSDLQTFRPHHTRRGTASISAQMGKAQA